MLASICSLQTDLTERMGERERESTLTLFRAELPESGLKRVELLGIRRANKAVQCWVSRVDRDWNASNVVESERSSDLISF